MWQLYHVARADVCQRLRSRRLLIVLAVVASIGYFVNVGSIELAYQLRDGETITNVHGEPTASFVGLKAGVTGAAVILFGGFYLMKGAVERDRRHDLDAVVASTPVSDRTYLAGKWLSNVALGAVVVATLGAATVVNHAVHGVGPTDPVALLVPLVLFALPLCALVGAVAVFVDSTDRLRGTGGNIGYLLLAASALGVPVNGAQGLLPDEIPVWVRATDLIGHLAVYELTAEALLVHVPDYEGGPPAFGTLAGDERIQWAADGSLGAWPLWIPLQRLALLVPAIAIVLAATLRFDRAGSIDSAPDGGSRLAGLRPDLGLDVRSRLAGAIPSLRRTGGTAADDGVEEDGFDAIDPAALTPVTDRGAGGFGRVVTAELRLAVRGHPRWWYAGAGILVVVPLIVLGSGDPSGAPVGPFRGFWLPLAFVWPLFVWSSMGVRSAERGLEELIRSSSYPTGQLLAEWIAGVVVAAVLGSGIVVGLVVAGETELLLGFASGILFAPSLAIAAGTWSRSPWLFEVSYLVLWYVGPLNGAYPIDFVGSTTESIDHGVPVVFVGLSLLLVGAVLFQRKRRVA